ncbi:hypothetical protein JCM11641_004420 [Rhodosporidiobolus odoratus]
MVYLSSQVYIDHLLSRLRSDLDFLSTQAVISEPDLQSILARLPQTQSQSQSQSQSAGIGIEREVGGLSLAGSSGRGQGQVGQQQPSVEVSKVRAKAVWDYHATQPDDLPFSAGDVIVIEEEVNGDWWKGSLNGRSGLFPSNHVERLSSPPPSSAQTAPVFSASQSTNASSYTPSYAGPPAPYTAPPPPSFTGMSNVGYAYSQPQGYGGGPSAQSTNSAYLDEKTPSAFYPAPPPPPPPAQNSYAPPLPPQPQPQPPSGFVVQQPGLQGVTEEEQKKNGKFGKFGKQMGTAFAGGMGFGAGSAVASNAINAIF